MTAHRTRRGLMAGAALVAGWAAGSLAVLTFGGLLVAGRDAVPDMLWFTTLIGLFALVGWLVSVLPLAVFADHRRWYFRPAIAPLVGAVSGYLLLTVQTLVFFGTAPWEYGQRWALLGLALLVGAVTWTVYTVSVRAWRRTIPAETPPGTDRGVS